jgi:ketosteroid isomerase-like protein
MLKLSITKTSLLIASLLVMPLLHAQQAPDPQELADQWTLAYNNHDRATLSSLYAVDANVMMHGSKTIKGQQAIGDMWAADFLDSNPITTLQVTSSEQGEDMVLVHGNYQVINRNDGLLLASGRFAHIYMLGSDGKWLLDRDLWLEGAASNR